MSDFEKFAHSQRIQTANRYLRSLVPLNQQKYNQYLQQQQINNNAIQHNALLKKQELKQETQNKIAEINRQNEIQQLQLQNQILQVQLEIEKLHKLNLQQQTQKNNQQTKNPDTEQFNNVEHLIQQQADLMFREELQSALYSQSIQTIIKVKKDAALEIQQLYTYDQTVEDNLLQQLDLQIKTDNQLKDELVKEDVEKEVESLQADVPQQNEIHEEEEEEEKEEKEAKTIQKKEPVKQEEINNNYLMEGLMRDIEEFDAKEREKLRAEEEGEEIEQPEKPPGDGVFNFD